MKLRYKKHLKFCKRYIGENEEAPVLAFIENGIKEFILPKEMDKEQKKNATASFPVTLLLPAAGETSIAFLNAGSNSNVRLWFYYAANMTWNRICFQFFS